MRSSAPAGGDRAYRVRCARGAGCALLTATCGLTWSSAACAEMLEATAGVPEPFSGIAALSVGRGLRLNNPFRLATPLGDTPESISLSATYLELAVGVLAADEPLRHGGALSGALALQGIGQLVLTPSYLVELDLTRALALRGRLGVPVVVAPDATLGLEAGFGSRLGIGYGLGVLVEAVGSVFFGAATEERSVTTIPIVALQLGICFERGLSW